MSVVIPRLACRIWHTLAAASCFYCHMKCEGEVMMIVREPKKVDTNKPVSLYTLMGRIASKKQFIEQTYPDTEEYWSCQRELAELERTLDKVNEAWMAHQRAPARRQ